MSEILLKEDVTQQMPVDTHKLDSVTWIWQCPCAKLVLTKQTG